MSDNVLHKSKQRLRRRMTRIWFRNKEMVLADLKKARKPQEPISKEIIRSVRLWSL